MREHTYCIALAVVGLLALPAGPAGAADSPAAAKQPEGLTIYFDPASAKVRTADEATLDQASRLYRDGKPIVMIVSGATDAVGTADSNLRLSEARANTVVRELVARGIPAERFQVVGKGETDLAVPTQKGVAEAKNRKVDITWR